MSGISSVVAMISSLTLGVASFLLGIWSAMERTLFQPTWPFTSLISSSLSPSLTTEKLIIRGSRPRVRRIDDWTAPEESKRMMKWWPSVYRAWCLVVTLGRRKAPQLVYPRTTPPERMTWVPALRAILKRDSQIPCMWAVISPVMLIETYSRTSLRLPGRTC